MWVSLKPRRNRGDAARWTVTTEASPPEGEVITETPARQPAAGAAPPRPPEAGSTSSAADRAAPETRRKPPGRP